MRSRRFDIDAPPDASMVGQIPEQNCSGYQGEYLLFFSGDGGCCREAAYLNNRLNPTIASVTLCAGEKTSLVRLGLEALIALESAKRLAILGGTEKGLRVAPRRRTSN